MAPGFEAAAGTFGNVIVTQGRSGTVLRARPTYRRQSSPDQRRQAARFGRASRAWAELTMDEADAWNAYADRLTKHDALSGRDYSPTGYNAFVALAIVLLRLDPLAPVPALPPVGGFEGDRTLVFATGEAGAARFTASAPNRAGVVTELMLQPLANVRRKPGKAYKGMAFALFENGALIADVPVEPGVYAAAYRFVERATGRVTNLRTLGKIVVGV